MSGTDFEETVLCSLELILEALSGSEGVGKKYLEEVNSLKKIINDLEIALKNEKSNSFLLKEENKELSEELKEIHLELEKLKSQNETYEKKISSMNFLEKENSSNDDDWKIPEKLFENSEFSLKNCLDEGRPKGKIVDSFKKFIIILTLESFDDENDEIIEFLDVKSSFVNDHLFKSAQREWKEGLHFGTSLLEISEELEKTPAKNRYNTLIEKFEKMIL